MLSSMEAAPPVRSPKARRPSASPPSPPSLVMAMVPPVGVGEVHWPPWLEPMAAALPRPAARKHSQDPDRSR